MRWRIPLVVTLALFVAVSCDQQPVEPAADQVADVPTFTIGDGPPESGAVIRGEYNDAWRWVDFKNGTQVIVGADIVEFCNGIINFDVFSFKDVYVNDRPLLSQAYGEDLRTAVYPFIEFDCGLFTSVEPLATGHSNMINTDNDLEGAWPGDNNANAWGVRAHGHLTRPNGDKAAFSGHLNMKWHQVGGYNETAKISLH